MKDIKNMNKIDQERKDFLEKCILIISQIIKIFELLYYSKSKKSISENNIIQKEIKL